MFTVVGDKAFKNKNDKADFFELLANHNSHYGEVPRVIKLSWIMVSKVIVALAKNYGQFRNYGEYMYVNCIENKDGTYEPKSDKAKFLKNVLLFIGELPLDTSITYGEGRAGRRNIKLHKLKQVSHTKEEQLLCLELMVARCWFDLFINKVPEDTCRYFQYLALEYMYWECSIDKRLSILWENLNGADDPVYQEARQLLYYRLFEAQRSGLLTEIFEFLNASINEMTKFIQTPDYKSKRAPRPIKKRRVNGVLVGFNVDSASTRGVRGRPGPIAPIELENLLSINKLLDYVRSSYPINSY